MLDLSDLPPMPALPTLWVWPSWFGRRWTWKHPACFIVRARVVARLARAALTPDPQQAGRRLAWAKIEVSAAMLVEAMRLARAEGDRAGAAGAGSRVERVLPASADWRQPLWLEQWVHRIVPKGTTWGTRDGRARSDIALTRYVLVCPGCGVEDDGAEAPPVGRSRRKRAPMNFDYYWCDKRTPCGGSVRRRALRLFLPLATPEEVRDAAVAAEWIRECRRRRAGEPLSLPEETMVARYAPVLAPRLMCRACLGLSPMPSQSVFNDDAYAAEEPDVSPARPRLLIEALRRLQRAENRDDLRRAAWWLAAVRYYQGRILLDRHRKYVLKRLG